jgi:hypothetical protein
MQCGCNTVTVKFYACCLSGAACQQQSMQQQNGSCNLGGLCALAQQQSGV